MDASTNTPVGPMGNQNGPTYVLSPGDPDAETLGKVPSCSSRSGQN